MLRQVFARTARRCYSTSLQPSAKQVAPQIQQAPNRATTWSASQRPKDLAMVGPRFEQADIAAQACPTDLTLMWQTILTICIAQLDGCYRLDRWRAHSLCLQAYRFLRRWYVLAPYLYADTYANIVLGGGALGHPKVYINLVCSDLEWRKSEYTGIDYAVPIRTSLAHMPADTVSFATYVEITLDCCTKWPVGGIRFQKQDDHHH